jgi:creatinine amidohydrolase
MLYSHPHLVARTVAGKLAGDDGRTAESRFQAINRGWVSITRPWHLLTTNTGSGYPHAASPEKAKKMLDILVDRLGTFLVELAAAKVDERFPY